MRALRRVLRLTVLAIAAAIAARWAVVRFRRILLQPTSDTTPPIRADEVAPQVRRIVISDLHLGAGDRLDDFDADAELATFIRAYVLREEPTELILAGDTFEFLQVRLPGLGDYEWSGEAAVRRLDAILQAHPAPIAALREFVARPGCQLTLLIGNHDFELHYAAAKAHLRHALDLRESDGRLRFGLTYSGGGMYIDHGMQFDPWNRFVRVDGISTPFEVVRGTRMVKEVINPLEEDALETAPLIDNVKPSSAFFWHMLSLPRLRQPHVRQFVVRGLLRLFRTNALPRLYYWNPRPALDPGRETSFASGVLQQVSTLFGRIRPAALIQLLRHQPRDRRSDVALDEVQREAKRQLRREIRAFEDAMLREIARIAASPAQCENKLFVCGHTHSAQVVPLNDQQTYINTGTWTAIVLDIATNRREEQRFPFLVVHYPGDGSAPIGQLLVWGGADVEPTLWHTEQLKPETAAGKPA
ncbi:MAG: metallophosphoesterase [Kouleothrix sp.]|nr:metallophosphoesterase [Kouleothrix sp.]